MIYKYGLFLLAAIAALFAFKLPAKGVLSFKTSAGHTVKVTHAQIFYDNRVIFKMKYDDDILYESKSNQVLEDHGIVFLFIAKDGRPNLDMFDVFSITPTKAVLVANAMLSPIKDYDDDGYLEFGGRDLTEGYSNPDSMYYVPTAWYEIRNGKIQPDRSLTRREDIKINGLYLPPGKQLNEDGSCCKVVPVPLWKRKKKPVIPPHTVTDGKPFMAYDTISVFAANSVLSHEADINYVVHNAKGKWFFYADKKTSDSEPITSMKKTTLGTVLKIDQSVLLLANLPIDHFADRSAKDAPWLMDTMANRFLHR